MVVDVVGYYAPSADPGGARFRSQQPVRLLDTREGGSPFQPNEVRDLGVPVHPFATVAVLNVTVDRPATAGFVTVYPADLGSRPLASNLNFVPGETVPNLVMVRLSPGQGGEADHQRQHRPHRRPGGHVRRRRRQSPPAASCPCRPSDWSTPGSRWAAARLAPISCGSSAWSGLLGPLPLRGGGRAVQHHRGRHHRRQLPDRVAVGSAPAHRLQPQLEGGRGPPQPGGHGHRRCSGSPASTTCGAPPPWSSTRPAGSPPRSSRSGPGWRPSGAAVWLVPADGARCARRQARRAAAEPPPPAWLCSGGCPIGSGPGRSRPGRSSPWPPSTTRRTPTAR